jgi:hypothetical protein
MNPDQIKGMAKSILDSVPGGMEGPDVAQLAMLLISALVFQTPAELGRRLSLNSSEVFRTP